MKDRNLQLERRTAELEVIIEEAERETERLREVGITRCLKKKKQKNSNIYFYLNLYSGGGQTGD